MLPIFTHEITQEALFGKGCGIKASGNKGFMILGNVIERCLKWTENFPKELYPTIGHMKPTQWRQKLLEYANMYSHFRKEKYSQRSASRLGQRGKESQETKLLDSEEQRAA